LPKLWEALGRDLTRRKKSREDVIKGETHKKKRRIKMRQR
jgi:hypothetical protein